MDPVKIASILGDDVLKVIYSMGAYTKEQLIQKVSAKVIQKWYLNKIDEYNEEETCFNISDSFKNNKSKSIRLINREYNTQMLMDYPTFAQNKVGIQEPFSGTKRSDVIKWMVENMNGSQLSYVGF
jgi:hypothetical protein